MTIFSEEFNYPIPDPRWRYANLWHATQAAKVIVGHLLLAMQEAAELETSDYADTIQQLVRSLADKASEMENLNPMPEEEEP